MRAYIKKRIIELLNTMYGINESLAKQVVCARTDIDENMFHQCQEYAIRIGDIIENTERDSREVIKRLENYCELVYQQRECLDQVEKLQSLVLEVNTLLHNLYCDIKFEFVDEKKVIVFLPYNAAMWDSMESIWQAACQDEDCECYVIPIPYYDKNPDGSLGSEHYEGGRFPSNVFITDWREYRLVDEHPDTIYIHNPYDQYNYVTSVHPDFYSSGLKRSTDMLVYVPYFISLEAISENYCGAIGVLRADRVILESEKIKQIYQRVYVDTLCKNASNKGQLYHSQVKKIAEEKFIALGSPKIDKLISRTEGKAEIPAEWSRLIHKESQRKKIFLYNMHISNLMKGKAKSYLKKLEQVMKIFRERRDVLLVWRPHPLSQATVESMNPEVYEYYKNILEEYQREGWGILDETPDLYVALSIADAYIGDNSSVMTLFGITGKPILQQNADLCEEEYKENYWNICMFDATEDTDRLWFWEWNRSALFEVDKHTGIINRISKYEAGTERTPLYSRVVKFGNKIFCIPHRVNNIAIYDLENKEYRKIDIKGDTRWKERQYDISFYAVETYQHWMFLIGYRCSTVIKVDMDKEQIVDHVELYRGIEKNTNTLYFSKQTVIVDGKLYIPALEDNWIFVVDIETMKYERQIINGVATGFSGICYDGEVFWIALKKGELLIQWNQKDNSSKSLSLHLEGRELNANIEFSELIMNGDTLWLFPFHSNDVVLFKADTGEVEPAEEINRVCDFRSICGGNIRFPIVKKRNEGIMAFTQYGNRMLTFDYALNDIRIATYKLPIEERELYARVAVEHAFEKRMTCEMSPYSYILKEDICLTLDVFIDQVLNNYTYSEKQKEAFILGEGSADGEAGVRIHSYIMNLL